MPEQTFLGLRVAFKSVWDTLGVGKTMTCDLQKKPARNPKPFVMQGLLSCLALHLEIALIGTCLITILFSLLLKVEKD